MAREEVFAASKTKSKAYLCLYFVSHTPFLPFPPLPSVKEETLPASVD